MFIKLFNYFFPTPKTMLDLAVEKVLAQTHVINNNDTIDLVNDQFFIVGTLTPNKASQKFESFNVLFSHDDGTVAIKENDEVLYYFNREFEVTSIRRALQEVVVS